MAVEASTKPNYFYDFDDEDDGPVVFKRNTAASRQNQANTEVKRTSSSTANAQNSNAQKNRTAVSSSKASPVKSSPPGQKAYTSSAKASPVKSPPPSHKTSTSSPKTLPVKSPVANLKKSSPFADRLKQSPKQNALVAVKKEEIKGGNVLKSDDEDSEDDKPLSVRLKGDTNNANQGLDASKADVAISKVNVKRDPEDSDDEVPLSSRFSKSNAGTSGAKPIDSDEKKPLASKVKQNGSTLREKQLKFSSVSVKRPLEPLDKASSSGPSSAKKPKVFDTSKVVKVKQVTVKAEEKAAADDHIPISGMKKSALSDDKSVAKAAKVTKSGSGDGQKKWTTLVHNGVIFPPPYTPHGVNMLSSLLMYDYFILQVAVMFAVLLEADYMQKPKFRANFWNDWRKLLGKNHVIQNLEDCDFKPIYYWHQELKEKKKQMSSEVSWLCSKQCTGLTCKMIK